MVIFALPPPRLLPRAEVFRHIILSRAVPAPPRPLAVREDVGHAPEGEPLFLEATFVPLGGACRFSVLAARLPRSGAPSPSAAGRRASLPDPISSPVGEKR